MKRLLVRAIGDRRRRDARGWLSRREVGWMVVLWSTLWRVLPMSHCDQALCIRSRDYAPKGPRSIRGSSRYIKRVQSMILTDGQIPTSASKPMTARVSGLDRKLDSTFELQSLLNIVGGHPYASHSS